MSNIGGQEIKKEPRKSNPQSNATNTGNAAAKKKKRPRNRIRHRNRNKSKTPNPDGVTPTTVEEHQAPTQPEETQPAINSSQPQKVNSKNETQERKPTTPKISDRKQNIINSTNIKVATVAMKPPTSTKTATAGSNEQATEVVAGKIREQVLAEREAKKLAKQAKKSKAPVDNTAPNTTAKSATPDEAVKQVPSVITTPNKVDNISTNTVNVNAVKSASDQLTSVTASVAALTNESKQSAPTEKTRDQIKAEREAKKRAKQTAKAAKSSIDVATVTQKMAHLHLAEGCQSAAVPTLSQQPAPEEKKKSALTKTERRAIQEAQRAAKSQAQSQKHIAPPKAVAAMKPVASGEKSAASNAANSTASFSVRTARTNDCKVKLFNHLESANQDVSLFVNNALIHPSVARLGEQYAKRTVVGSNSRCIAFLNALKMVIQDFETPPKKEFARSLEVSIKNCVDHLQKCRPLAVSVTNAYKHMKHVLTQLPTDQPESELKGSLCHFIDTYIENQIGKAAQAISSYMQEKISNGDVILTFSCSSLIDYIFEEAQRRQVDFRVIVVDSRPFCEGQEMLRRLTAKEIPCTYVLINAVGFVMPEVTKVLLGAHALLSNGYVMARAGTAQVALVARSFNVPVLVCCETHKFSERFQTDAIVYNELGNPDDLVLSDRCCLTNWQSKSKMSPLNLLYDITPAELVTAVVTEVSILPCSSVPVILRIKPTEIGYYS